MCYKCFIEDEIKRLRRCNAGFELGHPKRLHRNGLAFAKLVKQAKCLRHLNCPAAEAGKRREGPTVSADGTEAEAIPLSERKYFDLELSVPEDVYRSISKFADEFSSNINLASVEIFQQYFERYDE